MADPQDETAGDRRRRPTISGHRPTPYSERPVARARRAKAIELVEWLAAEGPLRVSEPADDEVAEWRRVVDYAKRHGLEPQGKRIERTRFGRRGLEMFLADGPHPNSRAQAPKDAPPVPIPTRLRSPHPVVAALRDDEQRLAMPPVLRRRSLLILQALSGEAVRRGHEVRRRPSPRSRREGEVEVVVNGFASTVTVKQEFPQSTNPERSGQLVIELRYSWSGRQSRWADRKSWSLEDLLGAVLREVELRAAEDAQRRADEERTEAEREVRWRAAMKEAKEQAVHAQFADALRDEAMRWQEATVLREYCDALERRLSDGDGASEESELAAARQWLEWARRYVQTIDPLKRPPAMPTPRDPTPEELKHHLKGWSPHRPEAQAGR